MWPNPQFPADLVTFTEEILNGNLHFLCIVNTQLRKVFNVYLTILGDYLLKGQDVKILKCGALGNQVSFAQF